ncbi:BA75_00952T0 [Komagataella pastoris]|uniref:BA75_00952T0 n=1 Tax=Komagataella pastoris TaxID=4922 RepID=A0A1B2J651_PICPA|nr:BA75_00952T0 [Komagataella pastoris]
MSSTIFYRFRSQKDLSRVQFDGTGITVFDLKREIILQNKLNSNLDFVLTLLHSDTNEPYDDDNTVIPRSSSVIARRSPPIKKGRGTAGRYLVGKPRISRTTPSGPTAGAPAPTNLTGLSEEERIQSMFNQQSQNWQQHQEELSTHTPVHYSKASEDAPPPGYICYRCGAKDHWIKNCPTNNDPNWEGKRVTRTTGIPKTYLKTVDKEVAESSDSNVMINENGEYVVAMANQKAWETYQKKHSQSNTNKELSKHLLSKVTDDRMIDPITKDLIKYPVLTPCCKKLYGKESIEEELLNDDFKCPNCGQEDILLDSLIPDDELKKQIDEFVKSNSQKRELEDDESPDEVNKRLKSSIPAQNLAVPQIPFMPMMMPFPLMGVPFIPPTKK